METNINISPVTLERARGAKEAIEKFYIDMINIKQERNERFRKIDQLLTQASFSEEEKTKDILACTVVARRSTEAKEEKV